MSEPTTASVEEVIMSGKFTGVIEISNSLYHRSPGLSSSGLVRFAECPAIYKYGHSGVEDTAAQRVGTLTHMCILEPEQFESQVLCISDFRGTKAKEAKEQAEAEAKYLCTTKEYEQARAMASSVLRRTWPKTLLAQGEREVSLYEFHPILGFLMKCRPDSIHPDKRIIADLKTFGKLTDRLIDGQIKRMHYDWKAAYYMEVASYVYKIPFNEWKFAHVFVSTDEPYEVRTIALTPPMIERSQERIFPLYPDYVKCLKEDNWPGYPDDVEDFNLWI